MRMRCRPGVYGEFTPPCRRPGVYGEFTPRAVGQGFTPVKFKYG
jgi:hypothetical protein